MIATDPMTRHPFDKSTSPAIGPGTEHSLPVRARILLATLCLVALCCNRRVARGQEIVDTRKDLNAYAKVENQSACCSPTMVALNEQPSAASCCGDANGVRTLRNAVGVPR